MIPEKFKARMQSLLGDEYPAFICALEHDDAVRGARVNLIKCEGGQAPDISGAEFTRIPYVENGYILGGEVGIGHTPEHHSGMIYMQDPGAMAAVSALDVEPDWWVADLCAAPGGKSSQVAERLGDAGFLLANEYVTKRAKIIVSNFERLGVKNSIVTSMDTSELAKMYSGVFNLVIADAPCSGEGMFRKSEEARAEWTEENVIMCASRQRQILNNAYSLLKPGGYLLYSTCTWSLEENEEVVKDFLALHDDMTLVPVREELRRATADGIPISGNDILCECRRFYPHISPGEGQFIALLRRDESSEVLQSILYKENVKVPTREECDLVKRFFGEVLTEVPHGRIIKSGNNIVLIPHGCPLPPHSVFMSGVLVGELKRGILHPSHQFFSVYGKGFRLKENLKSTDARIEEYLMGYEIATDLTSSGWCAVLCDGVALGGGKVSGGRIKNHYPKGLRNK